MIILYSADFEYIRDNCTLCKKCPLYAERLNIVFGQGNEKADILILGDFPTGKDDLQGVAFSGKEGEMLERFFTLCDIDAEKDIFVTDIIKCQPEEGSIPEDAHFDLCLEHLRNQVRMIKPKIIVCLGEITAKKMIDPSFNMSADHGKFIKKGKLFFIASYHPREIIEDINKRDIFLGDFQVLRETVKKTGITG